MSHLDDLLASGEHPIRVLAGFTSSLLKVHHAGRLRAARVSLEEACQIAGVFTVDKTRRQHAHLGPARVDRLPAMLAKADLDLKGGSLLDPRVVLEAAARRARTPTQGLTVVPGRSLKMLNRRGTDHLHELSSGFPARSFPHHAFPVIPGFLLQIWLVISIRHCSMKDVLGYCRS